MKTLLNFGIIGSSFTILILVLATSPHGAFGQITSTNLTSTNPNQTQEPQLQPFTITRDDPNEETVSSSSNLDLTTASGIEDEKNDDLVLLSQRYNDERFGDQIVGEILNNGSMTVEYVKVSISFYDENGAILGSQFTYTDPSTLAPGQKAAFTIFITSDTIEDDTETYEFTLQWQDNDFNEFSKRITGEQAESNDDNDSDNGNDNDNNDSGSINTLSSNNNSRCPDGFHRSPSGDCERVTDTSGMERCPDGFHRSPSGDCERVTDNNDNDNDNNNNDDNGSNNDNDNNNNDNDDNGSNNDNDNNNNDNDENDVEDSVRETVSESGIDFNFD